MFMKLEQKIEIIDLLYNVLHLLSETLSAPLCVSFFFCGVSVFISNLTIQRQHFPNDDDQSGAAKALTRLLDTYQLDTNTISTGELPGCLGRRLLSSLYQTTSHSLFYLFLHIIE